MSYDKEGGEVCAWLSRLGVTGILLKYRVPSRSGERYTAPLQDAQRTLGLVRQNAIPWGINPIASGILGFSAGGHLAAALSTNYQTRTYPVVIAADKLSCRPGLRPTDLSGLHQWPDARQHRARNQSHTANAARLHRANARRPLRRKRLRLRIGAQTRRSPGRITHLPQRGARIWATPFPKRGVTLARSSATLARFAGLPCACPKAHEAH